MNLYNMRQVAEKVSITYAKLQSAIYQKRLDEPKFKVGCVRLFNNEEIDAVIKYFKNKENS